MHRTDVSCQRKHGTFRPSLLSLVSSNSAEDIKKRSAIAFKALSESGATPPLCLHELTVLRGIGPATASLILSAYDWKHAPFFGDEVFRWVSWDEPPTKGTRGWDRKIAYSKKEYDVFYKRVAELVERLNISALDVELIGYVLGKERADLEKKSAEAVAQWDEGEKSKGQVSESNPQESESEASDVSDKELGRMKLKRSMADAKAKWLSETSKSDMDLKMKSSTKRKARVDTTDEPVARRPKRGRK
jgi:hypothetical protein